MSDHTPARSDRSGLALLVMAAAQLLMVMDGTIVTVGLPVIGADLRIPEGELDRVLTSYALAFGGLLLVGGRAGDLWGRRRLFRVGLVVLLVLAFFGSKAALELVLLMESEFAHRVKAESWDSYQHTFGSAGGSEVGIELDTDLMRLAAGGAG